MKQIQTSKAPKAVGPYSQAVVSGGFVFCSGQIPLTPDGEMIKGDIRAHTKQVCENILAVLSEAKSSLAQVVKSEVFLKDMNDFAGMNEVYEKFFNGSVLPARVTVEVARLPKDALVEIACIATTEV